MFPVGNYITSASFHGSGTGLSWIEALKILAINEESSRAKSFKIQLGMLSGPVALPLFRFESSLQTSCSQNVVFHLVRVRGMCFIIFQLGKRMHGICNRKEAQVNMHCQLGPTNLFPDTIILDTVLDEPINRFPPKR